jgi:hypothetical protein
MSGGAQTILKTQIRAVEPMDISLMPDGLADSLDPQRMTDLLSFLRQE